jgi:hypothetical protein
MAVLLRHVFASSAETTTAPVVFVVTHDTALHTLYDSLTSIIQILPAQTHIGIIRASDEPLYLVPDTADTASLLSALPLFKQLAPKAQLTTLLPTLSLITTHVRADATLVLLTDTSKLPRLPERTTQLSSQRGFTIIDFNNNSSLSTSVPFPVRTPAQLPDYLAQQHITNTATSSQIDRKRLFFILLGI